MVLHGKKNYVTSIKMFPWTVASFPLSKSVQPGHCYQQYHVRNQCCVPSELFWFLWKEKWRLQGLHPAFTHVLIWIPLWKILNPKRTLVHSSPLPLWIFLLRSLMGGYVLEGGGKKLTETSVTRTHFRDVPLQHGAHVQS